MTAAYPWRQLYAGDPLWLVAVFLGQVLVALFVGGLYVWWSAASEAARLRIGGARRLSRRGGGLAAADPDRGRYPARPDRAAAAAHRRPARADAAAGIRHIVINPFIEGMGEAA